MRRTRHAKIDFEEAVADDWASGLEVVEVPLSNRALAYLSVVVVMAIGIVGFRIFSLNVAKGDFYQARAQANAGLISQQIAPRGLIVDRHGEVVAQNRPVFTALLDLKEFLRQPDTHPATFGALSQLLNIQENAVWDMVKERDKEEFPDPIVLHPDVPQEIALQLKALSLPTLVVADTFQRDYPAAHAFSSVLGYTSLVNAQDLEENPDLSSRDLIGKAGLESQYDGYLRGTPGVTVMLRDAKGAVLAQQEKSKPEIGQTLTLTIDKELQEYFYERMKQGLNDLGRTSGAALALNPQTGEVLAMVSFPTYDNNLFARAGNNDERRAILNEPERPLFNRTVSGLYAPASTMKVLDAVAILKEKIVDPTYEIFSPGYLDIPNPYNPDQPTRYLDWRAHGNVNLYSAIAQSSDVYFYETIGGFAGLKGLGISRLRQWWQTFNFGVPTGIDLPNEAKGFLPSPDWMEKTFDRPWLVGDTYNVSIGQGDLTVSPIQLINYISAIANGGKIYRPYLAKDFNEPEVIADLTYLAPEIHEAQKGMRLAVTSPEGTARNMNDLPFTVWGKTGTAQVSSKTRENAFFVGYAAKDADTPPEIVVLVLVENSLSGGANTLPIAKDVLYTYWEKRMANSSPQR